MNPGMPAGRAATSRRLSKKERRGISAPSVSLFWISSAFAHQRHHVRLAEPPAQPEHEVVRGQAVEDKRAGRNDRPVEGTRPTRRRLAEIDVAIGEFDREG